MILPEYQKLFKPYAGKITLEGLLAWLQGEASKRKMRSDVMEVAIAQVFLELGQGRKFPTDGCKCGCDFTNPHSALAHHLRSEMVKIHEDVMGKYGELLEKRLQEAIKTYISYHKNPIKRFLRWIF